MTVALKSIYINALLCNLNVITVHSVYKFVVVKTSSSIPFVLSGTGFMNKSNTPGASSGTGTAHPSGTPGFSSVFSRIRVFLFFVYCVMVCGSLFFFCVLYIELSIRRFMTTVYPLVSSILS